MTRAPSIHATHQMSSIIPAVPNTRRLLDEKAECGRGRVVGIIVAVLANNIKESKPKHYVENESLVFLALPIRKSTPELKKASPRPPGMAQPRPNTADCCDAGDIAQLPTNTTAFPHPLLLCGYSDRCCPCNLHADAKKRWEASKAGRVECHSCLKKDSSAAVIVF